MKFFVINLERSADRREHITKEFHAQGVGFEISTAKDKFDLTQRDYEEFADPKAVSINWSHPIVPGLLACWISHQNVWKQCIASECSETVAIFEDDVTINEEFNRAIRILEEQTNLFDIVFLGKSHAWKPFKPLIEIGEGYRLGTVKYQDVGMYGYLINRQAMQRLIELFPKFRDFPIDDILHAPWLTNLRTYTLDPPVVFHPNNHESIIRSYEGGQLSNEDSTDNYSQNWQLLSKSTKWKRSLRKRVRYYLYTIGRY